MTLLMLLLFIPVIKIRFVREDFAFLLVNIRWTWRPLRHRWHVVVWGLGWWLDRGSSPFLGISDRLFWCTRTLSRNSDAFQKTSSDFSPIFPVGIMSVNLDMTRPRWFTNHKYALIFSITQNRLLSNHILLGVYSRLWMWAIIKPLRTI